jgi:DNA-binding FadR family transcriptional regulator
MDPVQPAERLHEAVARQLRDAILSGEYRSGERLPIERELSERFAVSRSAVRQALLLLDQQGLVRVRSGVGGGPFVAQETLPAAIAAFENVLAVDPTSVTEFARAKLVLEPAVNAMAAESISEDQIAALDANIAAARAGLERGDQVTDLMIDFHSALVNSTGNRFLALIVELMGRTLDRLPGVPGREHVDPRQVLAEHERMVAALRRHDVEEVRKLTVVHISGIWRQELGSD